MSLFYEEDTIQQMIAELEGRATSIKNIPREMLGEFVRLETFVYKYSRKRSAQKSTSQILLQEMEKKETSIMRLKRFAECSSIFRLYSIRTVDIHLYSLIYCLPAEEQLKAKAAIVDIATIYKQMGTKPRKPDMC